MCCFATHTTVCCSAEWLLADTQDQWLRGGKVPGQDERAHAAAARRKQRVQQQGKEDVVRATMSTRHAPKWRLLRARVCITRLVCFGSFLSSLFACCYEPILIWSVACRQWRGDNERLQRRAVLTCPTCH